MAKDLKFFMREQKEEIINIPAPPSFAKDEAGNPVEFQVKKLSGAKIDEYNSAYQTKKLAVDKRGVPYHTTSGDAMHEVTTDYAKATRRIIAEALVYPDLKDQELMKFYNQVDITEMPRVVFSDTEDYAHVLRGVWAVLGLGDTSVKDFVDEAKN